MNEFEYEINKEMLDEATGKDQFTPYENKISIRERIKMVGKNMAFLRKQAGLSQKNVADIINCAVQTYSGYENGRHEPNIESLVRLAWLYNVSLDTIVGKHQNLDEDENDEGIFSTNSMEDLLDNPKFELIQEKIKAMQEDIDKLKEKLK